MPTSRRNIALNAWHWDPPLKEEADFEKLHVRTLEVDWEQTERDRREAEAVFGGILRVEVDNSPRPIGQFPRDLIDLRGLDQMMIDMYDSPGLLHRIMSLLLDSAMRELDCLEAAGALRPNNKPEDYCGTGGVGCTDLLPAEGFDGTVRAKDLWGLAESQEFTGVGPDQFHEFSIRYQAKLMARYGLVYYGCCEALHPHLDNLIEHIPNLRAVSIAPWCDRAIAAEKLQDRYLYYWKPNPALTCAPAVNWDAVRTNIDETLDIARGCCLAMVLKDTHTFCGDAARPGKWVDLCRRAVDAAMAC